MWQADSVSGVLFRAPSDHQADALAVWGKLFPGDTPDSFNRASHSPVNGTSASGEREGLGVAVQASIGRLNIVLQNTVPMDGEVYPRIGDVKSAAARLSNMLNICAEGTAPPRAGILFDLGVTVQDGMQIESLNEYLGFPVFPKGSIDNQYQFNVRKQLDKVSGIEVNRLCTYYAGQAGFLNLNNVTQPSMVVPMVSVMGLKIDINSAPELRLPAGTLGVALDEMVEEALAIGGNPKDYFS